MDLIRVWLKASYLTESNRKRLLEELAELGTAKLVRQCSQQQR
jgi:hypothetical protein